MNKFFVNCFNFELDCKKLGMIRTKTANKKIAGIICFSPTVNFSRSL